MGFDSCFLKGWLLSAHLALEAAVLLSSCFLSPPLVSSHSLVYALVYKSRFIDSALFVVSERMGGTFQPVITPDMALGKETKNWSYVEEVSKRD